MTPIDVAALADISYLNVALNVMCLSYLYRLARRRKDE